MRALAAAALLCAALITGALAAGDSTTGYRVWLTRAALELNAAADHKIGGKIVVPQMHVPPAPLPGPPRFSPSLDEWLQAGLVAANGERNNKERAKELRALAAALRRASVETERAANTVGPPADPARTARLILSQPEYQNKATKPAPPHQKTLWERFLDWLARLFGELLSALSNAAGGSKPFGVIVAVVLIVAALTTIGLVSYRLARYFTGLRRPKLSGAGEMLPPALDAESLEAAAREHARAGRFAAAIACLFRAGLIVLARAGSVAFDASRTAGEYRRAVRRAVPAASPSFDAIAGAFTIAAYAQTPIASEDWTATLSAYERLTRTLGLGAPADRWRTAPA